jgi:hypothetical protein
MKAFLLLTTLLLPLFGGFFPNTVQTTVKHVQGNQIIMHHSFPVNGMSGVIVHTYKNRQQAIIREVIQTKKSTLTTTDNPIVLHEEMPEIKTTVTPGDKVIGGYLYHNVLLLAPNDTTYFHITRKYKKHWIHPDLYATYLAKEGEDEPTKENLATFAKQYRVGLIYMVGKDGSKLLDPISGKIVAHKGTEVKASQNVTFPFYSRFQKLLDTDGNYYRTIEKF